MVGNPALRDHKNSMRIGIDARLIEETGVGRYIRNLISELGVLDSTNDYVIFLRKKSYDTFVPPNMRWKKVVADVRWHTVAEQFVMPRLYEEAGLDVVHIPYHNPPILYQGRTVVTIHDLTILHVSTGKATTLPFLLYQVKRFGYWIELSLGLLRAKHIIAVSHATKREIIDHFHIPTEKITVTYEGVDMKLARSGKGEEQRVIDSPYFLYVGNAYPHKNLETLMRAWKIVASGPSGAACKLVLVGNDDFFYRRLKTYVQKRLIDRVVFFGSASDVELRSLYSHAQACVFPSLMEGFGLPALEALSLGCPVLVSDISVFHEILGEFATYVDPRNPGRIAVAMQKYITKPSKPAKTSVHLAHFLTQYSWESLAKETLDIYDRVVNRQGGNDESRARL